MDTALLQSIAEDLRKNIEVKDRTYRFKTYSQCFVGSDAVQYLLSKNYAENVDDAISVGEGLLQLGIFHHVTKDHGFKNEELFYRFAEDEAFHGGYVTSLALCLPLDWPVSRTKFILKRDCVDRVQDPMEEN